MAAVTIDRHEPRASDRPTAACEREPTGLAVLGNPALNKSTAFTPEERERYKLHGLLPPAVCSQEVQIERVLVNLRRKSSDIERYIFLQALAGRNERLFYRVLIDHIDEVLPLVYTPTVGQASLEFAHIFRQARGLYVTAEDRGRVAQILGNWPHRGVRVVVMTDGARILGLGDLGANGMAIPLGKLQLYTAFAGIRPEETLPIMLDVGTSNEALRSDPLYLGLDRLRLAGEEYYALVDETIAALTARYPDALLQFEDFATPEAYALLDRYRDRVLCFNDDIQGTAATVVAGIYASTRISRVPFRDLRVLFLGAGSAATGIADLLVEALIAEGLTREEAQGRLSLVDLDGLIVRERAAELPPHLVPFAHDRPPTDFLGALDAVRPHVLVGATGAPGSFTRPAIERMAAMNERPTIFALSNPTSRAECTAEEAYRWSDGRAIFASGSPFPPVVMDGAARFPSQSNNAYIFPGVGLGALVAHAKVVTDEMFLAAARTLAESLTSADLERGVLYPALKSVRELSVRIGAAVARVAAERGLARVELPADLEEAIRADMYQPYY